jgi:hypothetical protein
MTASTLILALLAAQVAGHEAGPAELPTCSNRVVNDVVRRVGCTLGDQACWARSGGFCTDHVERRLGAAAGSALDPVEPSAVRAGDIAAFAARAHYAVVERVVRDAAGAPVAVDLSESNFGSCWIDRALMITRDYKQVTRRRGVPLDEVDGGFLRARGAAPRG